LSSFLFISEAKKEKKKNLLIRPLIIRERGVEGQRNTPKRQNNKQTIFFFPNTDLFCFAIFPQFLPSIQTNKRKSKTPHTTQLFEKKAMSKLA